MVRGNVIKVGYSVDEIVEIIQDEVVEDIREFYKRCWLLSRLVRANDLVMGVG